MGQKSFQPLLEQWGEYVLEGDLVLHSRFTMSFLEADHSNEDTFGQVRTNTLLEVHAPESARNEPTPELGSLEERAIVKEHKRWKTTKEAISVYLLDDGSLLRFRYTPMKIRQTDAFNKHGEPILLVDGQTELSREPSFDQMRIELKKEQVGRKRKKSG